MKALLVVLLLLVPGLASAHGLRTRYVEVTIVTATTATIAVGDGGLALETEPGCTVAAGPVVQLSCRRGVAGALVTVTGLAANESAVVLLRDRAGAETTTVVTRAAPHITLPGQGNAGSVARRYVTLGITHVLGGVDHVLLLLALFWGARRRIRELALTATTFTVAHSVSLAATTLGWIRVPSAPAEAAIALSLVLVALDVGRGRERPGLHDLRERGLVAAFGLVHGLGFAGALAEIGMPRGAVPTALLAFNIGVEIAQALVLGGCLVLALLATRMLRIRDLRVPEAFTAYAVGIAGTFLFLDRTSLFLR